MKLDVATLATYADYAFKIAAMFDPALAPFAVAERGVVAVLETPEAAALADKIGAELVQYGTDPKAVTLALESALTHLQGMDANDLAKLQAARGQDG